MNQHFHFPRLTARGVALATMTVIAAVALITLHAADADMRDAYLIATGALAITGTAVTAAVRIKRRESGENGRHLIIGLLHTGLASLAVGAAATIHAITVWAPGETGNSSLLLTAASVTTALLLRQTAALR
jgi:hypothetical protein